jgi:hypothetical protein
MSRALATYARWKIAPSADLVERLVQATGWLEQAGRNQNISLNYGWLAEMAADLGRSRDVWRYAARARRRARRHDPMGEAMALRAVARIVARDGGRRAADHYLALAAASARRRNAPHEIAVTRLCETELALIGGEWTRASTSLAEARAGFRVMDMAWFEREAISLARRLEARPDR